ncbi:MAG: ABC transporter permease [Spartobacteria bacterium]|nr:ABC transporter permease [Spartobacteria bacterium]
MQKFLSAIGAAFIHNVREAVHLSAVIWTCLRMAFLPRYWTRPVRDVFARQILFTGVEATRFIMVIAFLLGVSIIVQIDLWLNRFGQSAMVGPLLVAIIIREAAPLVTNFAIIGRSGTAIAAEMASVRVSGEISLLDSMGIDPMIYLVIPRVLGMGISVFCLTQVFIFVSLASGCITSQLFGLSASSINDFVFQVLESLTLGDFVSIIGKTLIPGMVTAAICCEEGMEINMALTEIPKAATRGQVRSLIALVLLSAVMSLLVYL